LLGSSGCAAVVHGLKFVLLRQGVRKEGLSGGRVFLFFISEHEEFAFSSVSSVSSVINVCRFFTRLVPFGSLSGQFISQLGCFTTQGTERFLQFM
jgi:hypothetical protein